VRGPRETVEKETVGHETIGSKKYNPPPPERPSRRRRWGTLTTTMGRKIGAIVGEGARVGANSVLKPGSLVKRGEHVAPLTHYG